MYDTVIVGAGASGVMCAIKASNRGKKVLLIDGDNYPAKKLMVTGNGRCNLTNKNMDSKYFNQNIDCFLSRFNEKDTFAFFEDLGLLTFSDEEGRVYPYSRSARSVVDVINKKLEKNNIEIKNNEIVKGIEYFNKTYNVLTNKGKYLTKSVVIAVGGFAKHEFMKNFKIDSNLQYPSLCALKSENTKKLSGIRLSDVEVTAKCNGQIKKDKGEVLFKDEGLSGIVIFNLSSLFARAGKYVGEISINLMPDFTKKQVEKILINRLAKEKDVFKGWFQDEVANLIVKKSGIKSVGKSNVQCLVDIITNMTFEINGFYPNNQVCSGGVKIESLTDNLESKYHKGLYFTGEIVDVDGECGGYNLQWAWTSGAIVGDAL